MNMRIIRFEDVESWKEGRILCKMVYEIARREQFATDFGLRNQIQRAAVSVVSNIAEGFDSRSNPEFQRFLIYARRSLSEVKCQLYIALDAEYISQQEFTGIYDQADKVGRLANGFIRFLSLHRKPPRITSNKQTNKPTNEQTN